MNPSSRLAAALLGLPKGLAESVIVAVSVAASLALTSVSLGELGAMGVDWRIPVAIATIVPLLVATPVSLVLMSLLRDLDAARREADALASTDMLTGVYNRRRWLELAERELRRCAGSGLPISVLLIDIDRFKQVNDAFGHAAGDEVLRAVAGACRAAVGHGGSLARWGGEEFVVLLPDVGIHAGLRVAERIRDAVAAQRVPTPVTALRVTASVGVAGAPEPVAAYDLGWLLRLADQAMYAAKRGGRDRVEPWGLEPLVDPASQDRGHGYAAPLTGAA